MADEDCAEHRRLIEAAQAYNERIMTVGYATFFGLLFFLRERTSHWLLIVACIAMALSASAFIVFELRRQIYYSKVGSGERPLGFNPARHWKWHFWISLTLAGFGVLSLFWLLVRELLPPCT